MLSTLECMLAAAGLPYVQPALQEARITNPLVTSPSAPLPAPTAANPAAVPVAPAAASSSLSGGAIGGIVAGVAIALLVTAGETHRRLKMQLAN